MLQHCYANSILPKVKGEIQQHPSPAFCQRRMYTLTNAEMCMAKAQNKLRVYPFTLPFCTAIKALQLMLTPKQLLCTQP
jgi:hypothetical protein